MSYTTSLNPGRNESRPFLTTKRDVLFTVVRSADKVTPNIVHVIIILHEKERRHLSHETRKYMMVAPADFSKFIVVQPSKYHLIFRRSASLNRHDPLGYIESFPLSLSLLQNPIGEQAPLFPSHPCKEFLVFLHFLAC